MDTFDQVDSEEKEKARQKAYYEAHREERLAKNKAWREANKERRQSYMKEYTEANKERRSVLNKEWRENNKEYIQTYLQANKPRTRAYRAANKERINAYQRDYRKSRDDMKDRRHGLCRSDKRAMAERQEYRCAVCGKQAEQLSKLYVDHNHVTGKVRELLCPHCNYILGHCFEDVDILSRAIAYLDMHSKDES